MLSNSCVCTSKLRIFRKLNRVAVNRVNDNLDGGSELTSHGTVAQRCDRTYLHATRVINVRFANSAYANMNATVRSREDASYRIHIHVQTRVEVTYVSLIISYSARLRRDTTTRRFVYT